MYAQLLAMPNTPAHSTLTSTTSDHLFLNRTYHNPFGFRVRQLLRSLVEDPPSVMPAYEYLYPPHLMPSPTLCPGMFSTPKTCLPLLYEGSFWLTLPLMITLQFQFTRMVPKEMMAWGLQQCFLIEPFLATSCILSVYC